MYINQEVKMRAETRRKLWKTSLACLALAGAAGVHGQDVVKVGNLKFAHFGAVSYMKEIAPKYNLRLEERVFSKGTDIMPAIIAGEIDASASGSDAAITARAAGVPVYAVAGFSRGGARIVAQPGLGVRSVADLKGKTVGVTRGGAQELLLLAELEKHGLSSSSKPGKDVLIVYLTYPDLNAALLGKQIDAMCQSEPYSTQAINKKFGVEVVKPYDTPLGRSPRALVLTEKMYKSTPDVAYRFVKLFLDATLQFQRNPALAEKYVTQTLFKSQLTVEDYRDAMSNAEFSYDLHAAEIQVMTDMMVRFDMAKLGKPPVAQDWVKTDLLDRAKKEFGLP
jgi:NitT/TauT family transport system substrate-binding protein